MLVFNQGGWEVENGREERCTVVWLCGGVAVWSWFVGGDGGSDEDGEKDRDRDVRIAVGLTKSKKYANGIVVYVGM